MSYGFLIDSIGADKYSQISPEFLITEIKKRWPLVETQINLESSYLIEWKLAREMHVALCAFHDNNETISVQGDLSLAAEVAAWYRALVTNEYELFFYTRARLDKPIKLHTGITGQEIVHIFNNG